MTTEPTPLPDEADLFRGADRGFSPKQDVPEPDEAPPGQAGPSRTPPSEE